MALLTREKTICWAVLALTLLTGFWIAPASAAEKYTQGSPEFTAMIVGTNEFHPGDEATVQVLVRNTGLNLFKQVNSGTIAQDDLPNTAKFATIGLSSTTPLIVIKSDPRYVGDIPGNGGYAVASFTVKITADATAQDYSIPVSISYKVPVATDQPSSESYQYVYNTANVTVPLTLHIKPGIKVNVLEAAADNITAGANGIIRVRIQNTGPVGGKDATLKVMRNGKSPIVPVDSSVWIGDISAGEIIDSQFKVSVSDDAGAQTYPVDIAVAYTDTEGSVVTAAPVTVGIPVLSKANFAVVSPPGQVAAGSSATITVQYRNTGSATVYAAQAGITGHTPVTINNDVSYLGDIPAGETASAVFTVQADSSAEPGNYSFDTRVRYRDAYATSIQSDTGSVTIQVLPAGKGIANSPVVLVLIAAVVLGAAVLLLYRYRKGNQ